MSTSSDFVGWSRDQLVAEVMRLRRISMESLTFAQDALIDADYMESVTQGENICLGCEPENDE